MNPLPDKDPLITKRQLADLVGTTERTIDNWRRDFDLPCLKVGHTVKFRYGQVVRHLEKLARENRAKAPKRPAQKRRK